MYYRSEQLQAVTSSDPSRTRQLLSHLADEDTATADYPPTQWATDLQQLLTHGYLAEGPQVEQYMHRLTGYLVANCGLLDQKLIELLRALPRDAWGPTATFSLTIEPDSHDLVIQRLT